MDQLWFLQQLQAQKLKEQQRFMFPTNAANSDWTAAEDAMASPLTPLQNQHSHHVWLQSTGSNLASSPVSTQQWLHPTILPCALDLNQGGGMGIRTSSRPRNIDLPIAKDGMTDNIIHLKKGSCAHQHKEENGSKHIKEELKDEEKESGNRKCSNNNCTDMNESSRSLTSVARKLCESKKCSNYMTVHFVDCVDVLTADGMTKQMNKRKTFTSAEMKYEGTMHQHMFDDSKNMNQNYNKQELMICQGLHETKEEVDKLTLVARDLRKKTSNVTTSASCTAVFESLTEVKTGDNILLEQSDIIRVVARNPASSLHRTKRQACEKDDLNLVHSKKVSKSENNEDFTYAKERRQHTASNVVNTGNLRRITKVDLALELKAAEAEIKKLKKQLKEAEENDRSNFVKEPYTELNEESKRNQDNNCIPEAMKASQEEYAEIKAEAENVFKVINEDECIDFLRNIKEGTLATARSTLYPSVMDGNMGPFAMFDDLRNKVLDMLDHHFDSCELTYKWHVLLPEAVIFAYKKLNLCADWNDANAKLNERSKKLYFT